MRRTRELTFGHYVAIGLPVVGAAFGTYYFVKHRGADSGKETAAVMKPSQYKGGKKEGAREIASSIGERAGHGLTFHEDEEGEGGGKASHGAKRAVANERDHGPSAALEAAANDAVDSGKGCGFAEVRGDGPEYTRVTRAEWAAVMGQFHGAKDALTAWLKKHRAEIPEATASLMERQVRNLKIQRPPSADEPDLAWRGIGVFTQGNAENEPLVKIGGGFVKFALKNPARAKFEMTRLVAQAWAPCELHRVAGDAGLATFTPLLRCLGVPGGSDAASCGIGTYSDAGWAVSTTLAASLSPPACGIQAFQAKETAQCLKQIPLAAHAVAAPADAAHGAPARGVASEQPSHGAPAGHKESI